ncbi:NAD-dependent epimerase/dehydratase family protein [Calothrix sp. UHCC 0171]|uniref:NAD-dependent epimerase/dehydratase family protein n=1 Tax=Calothrix sp. UHCC 0171 TaxID=3110245 RepID=UPI002B1FD52F|nr:NAD-dependent epimerase/dehydratase family protein [Calothrix sp. UHCC 0171]MEA5573718.1 NAD-dependent epimerase/dehydratase family protein [Calothrix sp. UHCC 0171]
MNILITGGTGFLGRKLAEKLKSVSQNITVIGRNQEIGKQLETEGIRFLNLDLIDREATIKSCKKQDYIFHCAALSAPWGKYQDFYNANVVATKNIIQACQQQEVKRLIYVSTPSVYFDFTNRLNISENDTLAKIPANAYVQTKLLAETEIQQAYQQGLPVISIRPRGIFGCGDTAILPRLIRANQKTGIPLINQGKSLIDMTYVDNVVDALILCQQAPNTLLGRTFNITNGEPMYLIDLLNILSEKLESSFKFKAISYPVALGIASLMETVSKHILFGREPILTRYTVGVLACSQTLDITAAKIELGYQPQVTIEEGLSMFSQWWKSQNETSKS